MMTSLLTSSTSKAEKDFDNISGRGEGIMGKSQQRDENSHMAFTCIKSVAKWISPVYARRMDRRT